MKKTLLIIGGTHGIGRSIVDQLYTDHDLHVISREPADLPAGVTHHQQDVLEHGLEGLDLPDVLDGMAYCPGSINLKPFKMLKDEAFHDAMNINFFGLLRCFRESVEKLKAGNDPSVVAFSTVAVGTGMPFHTAVAAAKGAVEGFARAAAAEYAPTLRINVIAPSLTDTPLAGRLLGNDKKKEMMAQRHPLKQYGQPEDIAHLASFLLSNKSKWITGQTFGVDGGMSTLNLS